jgi:hypothetical protein
MDFPYVWLVRVPLTALLMMLVDLAVRAFGGYGVEVTVWLSKVSSTLLVLVWLCQWFVAPAAIYGCLYRPAWRSWRHGLALLAGVAYWAVVGRMLTDDMLR